MMFLHIQMFRKNCLKIEKYKHLNMFLLKKNIEDVCYNYALCTSPLALKLLVALKKTNCPRSIEDRGEMR